LQVAPNADTSGEAGLNKEDDMTDELMVDVTAEKRKPECKRI
jgi:hypothetical protein